MGQLLEARGLLKIYRRRQGDVVVLRDCDFSLAEAEAVAVTGPSGAGKSTLLNLLGGLDLPDAGEVSFRGEPLPRREGHRLAAWRNRQLGFVFQFHFLLPDFSALENVLIPARMAGDDGPEARRRAEHLLAAVGLSDRADHLPGELSGGEQQRVAVARAFINHPTVVLADEPFGNLDRNKGREIEDLLQAIRREEGVAFVVVTHDLELAGRADRALRLDGGRLSPAASGGRA